MSSSAGNYVGKPQEVALESVSLSEKRGHSVQNIPSSYKTFIIHVHVSTEVNSVKL